MPHYSGPWPLANGDASLHYCTTGGVGHWGSLSTLPLPTAHYPKLCGSVLKDLQCPLPDGEKHVLKEPNCPVPPYTAAVN